MGPIAPVLADSVRRPGEGPYLPSPSFRGGPNGPDRTCPGGRTVPTLAPARSAGVVRRRERQEAGGGVLLNLPTISRLDI